MVARFRFSTWCHPAGGYTAPWKHLHLFRLFRKFWYTFGISVSTTVMTCRLDSDTLRWFSIKLFSKYWNSYICYWLKFGAARPAPTKLNRIETTNCTCRMVNPVSNACKQSKTLNSIVIPPTDIHFNSHLIALDGLWMVTVYETSRQIDETEVRRDIIGMQNTTAKSK